MTNRDNNGRFIKTSNLMEIDEAELVTEQPTELNTEAVVEQPTEAPKERKSRKTDVSTYQKSIDGALKAIAEADERLEEAKDQYTVDLLNAVEAFAKEEFGEVSKSAIIKAYRLIKAEDGEMAGYMTGRLFWLKYYDDQSEDEDSDDAE